MPPKHAGPGGHAGGEGGRGGGVHRGGGGGGVGRGGGHGGGEGGRAPGGGRKKSLLIGINYTGSQHQLAGCLADIENVGRFISKRGYSSDPQHQLVLRDDQPKNSHFYPTGANMLAAMDWLVSEPHTTCFMHYSGHGGQVPDPDGDRASGFDDTLVPVDFERAGQISSDVLHKTLVSKLPPSSTLFVVLDCCHSGSALELPYVYRSDSSGNINFMDKLATGKKLLTSASHLIQGGGTLDFNAAKDIFGQARSFFGSSGTSGGDTNAGEGDLKKDQEFAEDWASEKKHCSMFSGCSDSQTSDANIKGKATGAMSWAFLKSVRADSTPTYAEILKATRLALDDSHYEQVPQLSMGMDVDLDAPLMM